MKNYSVRKYQSTDYVLWNAFVADAKNATFLFHRDFMEYHRDRFIDYSLLIFDENQNLKAVLPANRVEDVLYSHQGLTYGGLVLSAKSKLQDVLAITFNLLRFLYENNISILNLKQIPSFYTKFPSEEIDYLSFILKAETERKDTFSVINLQQEFFLTKGRMEGVKKGKENKLICKEEDCFEAFWNEILIPNLDHRHGVKPVHSVNEITYLKSKFPTTIRQFNVYKEDKIVAGTTVFVAEHVVHSQYISGNTAKNELGSLDFLHDYLLHEVFADKKYFDFGTSNENKGKNINQGLLFWKESFGARTLIQNFYEIPTANYSLLEHVLI